MLVGHFAAGFAAKALEPKVSLGVFFTAAMLLDFIWALLVLAGIEQAGFDHGLASFNGLDMIYIPYSHSLGMSLIWGCLFGFCVGYCYRSRSVAVVVCVLVVSHWLLDYLTHIPDMPLWFDGASFGLGLWRSSWITFAANIFLLLLAISVYLKAGGAPQQRSPLLWSLIACLLVLNGLHAFGPKQPETTSAVMIAGPALVLWLPVIWGYLVDRRGQPSKDA